MMKRAKSVAIGCLIAAAISAGVTAYLLEIRKMPRIHKLEFPLMLEGSAAPGRNYLLPKGTTLYFEQAFPEGFVRYRIYVNVEGVDLPTKELADPTAIDPLSAYPIGKAELTKLLREYPLSKSDLVAILKSGQLSKQDIREILTEFSK